MGPDRLSRQHLAPFLPDHRWSKASTRQPATASTIGQVSAAPWGSASDPADLLGLHRHDGRREGLKTCDPGRDSERQLHRQASGADHYPVLYTGKNGMVAHECIIDLRQIKEACGVSVDDVAKRLVDYGFHAPTMSFPVPDTLMIEPTESPKPSGSSTASVMP